MAELKSIDIPKIFSNDPAVVTIAIDDVENMLTDSFYDSLAARVLDAMIRDSSVVGLYRKWNDVFWQTFAMDYLRQVLERKDVASHYLIPITALALALRGEFAEGEVHDYNDCIYTMYDRVRADMPRMMAEWQNSRRR